MSTPINYRKQVISALLPYAEKDPDFLLLLGDMGFGAIDEMAARFPEKIFNLGIMEQGMFGVAAGLAMGGKHPVVYTMVNFIAFRALEQIRNDIVLQHLPVKIIGTGANDYFKFLGASHCCGDQDRRIMELIGIKIFDPYAEPKTDFNNLIDRFINHVDAAYLRV